MSKRLTGALLVVLACGLTVVWATGVLRQPRSGPAAIVQLDSTPSGNRLPFLRVATWNIAYDAAIAPPAEHLRQVVQVLKASRADVVLLQGVDFDSARSGRIDQLLFLAMEAGYAYAAYAPAWRAGYVPLPLWPLGAQIGRVDAGGGILSRFPIMTNTVNLFDEPATQATWQRLFAPNHYRQTADVQLAAGVLRLHNIHLDPNSVVQRTAQAAETAAAVSGPNAARWTILGGSLNATPPDAELRHGFVDNPTLDYRTDATLKMFLAAGLIEAADAVSNVAEAFWTYPAAAPTRRLDYLFATTALTTLDAYVLRTAGIGRHLPVIATYRLP